MNDPTDRHAIDTTQTKEEPFTPFGGSIDWRVWFGVAVTFLWLVTLALYISARVGWSNVGDVDIDTMGGFLEGAFAPLAFLWFVLAFFSQQKELAQNTTALKMQYIEVQKSAEQAAIQSEAIRASELHARRESFLRIAESVKDQLGAIMGFLYLSSQGGVQPSGVENNEPKLWAALGQNDSEVFSRAMLQLLTRSSERYGYKLLYGTAVRTRHCESFIFNFERLLRAADSSDEDGMIRDALLGSGHGRVYQRMIRFRDNPPAGFSYAVYDFDPDTID